LPDCRTDRISAFIRKRRVDVLAIHTLIIERQIVDGFCLGRPQRHRCAGLNEQTHEL
jgi:hypothetical protein